MVAYLFVFNNIIYSLFRAVNLCGCTQASGVRVMSFVTIRLQITKGDISVVKARLSENTKRRENRGSILFLQENMFL